MKTTILFAIATIVLFSSCVTRQYYLSPFQASDHAYKAIPMVSDSAPSAFYASVNLAAGGANQSLRDGLINLQGTIHRSHAFRNLQFLYGGSLSAGGYHLSSSSDYFNSTGNPTSAFSLGGSRFFGGAGAFAGVNLVIPFQTGSEWRVIGVESSFQHEFGDYAKTRMKIPDSAADLVWRKNYFHTVGLATNVIKKFRKSGNTFGYKFGIYFSTAAAPYTGADIYKHRIWPGYVSNTLHLSRQRVTGYVQINAGSYAMNFQTGFSVRLGKK